MIPDYLEMSISRSLHTLNNHIYIVGKKIVKKPKTKLCNKHLEKFAAWYAKDADASPAGSNEYFSVYVLTKASVFFLKRIEE